VLLLEDLELLHVDAVERRQGLVIRLGRDVLGGRDDLLGPAGKVAFVRGAVAGEVAAG
jgi:hypothetical protein